jgi:hypothetical protein
MAILVCRAAKSSINSASWSSFTDKVLANVPVFVKGYGNGGHDRRFAKCWEDFAASRPCSK